jgi:hypothetical protein
MMKEAPWWTMHLSKDINKMFDLYCEIIKIIMNTHIPLKNIRINTTKPIWMTKDYCEAIESVSLSKKKAVELGTEESWTEYKKLRNKYENYKTKLKFESIKEHIDDNINQSKTAWKIFNNEIGKSKQSETIKMIEVDGIVSDTEVTVAQSFCDYFTNNVESSNKIFTSPNANPEKETDEIMECPEISHAEILSSIKHLKVNKPTGSDGIPAKFYKLFAEPITPILHTLFNECLKQGEVPLVLRKTFIKCLYKGKGKKNSCTNYRPISIISSTSKIYENIMYRRLSKYLEDNNLLSESQHGYRRHRSTESAVLEVSNHIRKAGDSKKFSGLLFVDFQKAFDMINHDVLLQQLSNLGIRNQNLEWFKSYFKNRQIAVRNGQSLSEFKPITKGTPQGSSLSGILFSIYINLVPNIFKH